MSCQWLITKEQLKTSPSGKCGIAYSTELMYQQESAVFIEEVSKRLDLGLVCMNTAVLFFQRFYMYHSHTLFDRYVTAATCVFLSAKVEENLRKLDMVVKVVKTVATHITESVENLSNDIVALESVLLQTLGFQVSIEHPHAFVIYTTTAFNFPKEFARKCYVWARHILHLTPLGMIYKPVVIACVSIYICSKIYNVPLPEQKDNNDRMWFNHSDETLTLETIRAAGWWAIEIFKNTNYLYSKDKEILLEFLNTVRPLNDKKPPPKKSKTV